MKKSSMLFALLFVVGLATHAMAVGKGKTVEFAGGSQGKVVFSGDKHIAAGVKCIECHPKVFASKRVAKITQADHVPGKFCGTCHDGKRAFAVNAKADCAKCHTKA